MGHNARWHKLLVRLYWFIIEAFPSSINENVDGIRSNKKQSILFLYLKSLSLSSLSLYIYLSLFLYIFAERGSYRQSSLSYLLCDVQYVKEASRNTSVFPSTVSSRGEREPKGTGRVIARDASGEFKKWPFVDTCASLSQMKEKDRQNREEKTKYSLIFSTLYAYIETLTIRGFKFKYRF